MSTRSRNRILLAISLFLFIYSFTHNHQFPIRWTSSSRLFPSRQHDNDDANTLRQQVPLASLQSEFFTWSDPDSPPGPKPPSKPPAEPSPPIPDPFPLLSQPDSLRKYRKYLQAVGENAPPKKHYPQKTPLLVGFTRNWPQLLQCVVSYIAAGWPPEDIYVVENTGTMFSNREGKLGLQNPFYLNHTQLGMLGVNVIITPTLLTFAQLQNFYLWEALNRSWPTFFWTHQDLLVFSSEDDEFSEPHYTLYDRAVSVLQFLLEPTSPKWAHHFFAYDHLTLVNTDALLSVGGWDTQIPFYATDCDMYVRLMWAGFWQGESEIGIILDVATVLDDIGALFRIPGIVASFQGDPNATTFDKERIEKEGETHERLVDIGRRMEGMKYQDGENTWRNTWQLKQRGGQGEPFYRDAEGFEYATKMMIDLGRAVFAEKWGHRGCDIAKIGIKPEDAWRLERDWERDGEGGEEGYEGDGW